MKEKIINNILHEILSQYSDLDPMMPPLCLHLSNQELAGAIYCHCEKLNENDFEKVIDEIWDELDAEDLEEAREYRTEISRQVLQLLLDAYN